MKNYFILFFIISILSCNTHQKCCEKDNITENKKLTKKIDFEKAMFVITKKVIDLTSYGDLLFIDEFREIYENPSHYVDDAIHFLSTLQKNDTTYIPRLVAITCMANLNADNYVAFIEKYFMLYENKLSFYDKNEISVLIIPHLGRKNNYVHQYCCPKIKNKLLAIRKKMQNMNMDLGGIDRVLSGMTSQNWIR